MLNYCLRLFLTLLTILNMPKNGSRPDKICDLTYLNQMMFGNKEMIGEIINDFKEEIVVEIKHLQHAVSTDDFLEIKRSAHKMISTAGIMGISSLVPLLNEMEILGAGGNDMNRIKILADKLKEICQLAIIELK